MCVYHAIYIFTQVFCRYLGLFGDHIVPAVLYRYTQVLRRPDLLSSKGKPLVTTARLEAVWKRLADRLATVVSDTSMITMSTAYTAHFYDIYIDGKENAKMTGDRMKMLMLTLPFMVRDLIKPEVIVYTSIYYYILCVLMHILLYTRLISSTPPSTRPSPAPVCTTCHTCLIPVMRWWMFSFSAWTGTYPLASPVFHCQSFLNCTRRQLISWTFSSATCPTRPAKRPSGISKRPTAYYTRSARLCCGAIRITARAKPQRYHVFTGIYTYIIVYTCIYRYIPQLSSDMHVLTSMPTSRISRRWPT